MMCGDDLVEVFCLIGVFRFSRFFFVDCIMDVIFVFLLFFGIIFCFILLMVFLFNVFLSKLLSLV